MSDLRVNSIAGADGTSPATLVKQSAAKVYGRYTYNSGVPTIVNSLNVSSLTDTGTGTTTINLTSSFSASDAHSLTCSGRDASTAIIANPGLDITSASQLRIFALTPAPALIDAANGITFSAMGDLA